MFARKHHNKVDDVIIEEITHEIRLERQKKL